MKSWQLPFDVYRCRACGGVFNAQTGPAPIQHVNPARDYCGILTGFDNPLLCSRACETRWVEHIAPEWDLETLHAMQERNGVRVP